jgi:hypothetical protein
VRRPAVQSCVIIRLLQSLAKPASLLSGIAESALWLIYYIGGWSESSSIIDHHHSIIQSIVVSEYPHIFIYLMLNILPLAHNLDTFSLPAVSYPHRLD